VRVGTSVRMLVCLALRVCHKQITQQPGHDAVSGSCERESAVAAFVLHERACCRFTQACVLVLDTSCSVHFARACVLVLYTRTPTLWSR